MTSPTRKVSLGYGLTRARYKIRNLQDLCNDRRKEEKNIGGKETLVVGCPPRDAIAFFCCTHSAHIHSECSFVFCAIREKIETPGFYFCFYSSLFDADDAQRQWSECFSTYLLQYRSDVLQRQRRKLILLQEIIQVLLEHFKHQACVILMLEAFERSHKVELVGVFLA